MSSKTNLNMALVTVWVIAFFLGAFLPLYDFSEYFYPAAVEASHLRNPYTVEGFVSPPWTLLILFPLGWLPLEVARGIFFATMLVTFMYVPISFGVPLWSVIFFLVQPPVLFCLYFGNIEWIVLLGLVAAYPFNVGLFSVKPQAGVGGVLYQMWHNRGDLDAILLSFLLVLVATSLLPHIDFVAEWFGVMYRASLAGINGTLWPWGLLVGIPLLGIGIKYKKPLLAYAAGPFLSPYVLWYSWTITTTCGLILFFRLWKERHQPVTERVVQWQSL